MTQFLPRLVLAAMRGGAGKTTLSIAMAAAWKRRGKRVVPFKKGPDYIDSAWLSLAAGQSCHNLDTFLMGAERVRRSFRQNALSLGLSLVEGNRGLFDGTDEKGSYSTAELAKLLGAPVILVVDANKVTRTAAALVLGCQKMDPGVDIRGVILNRVAGLRHEKILRQTIEEVCRVPILGAVPRMEDFPFPERHLGLIPPQEHSWVQKALDQSADLADEYLDLEKIWAMAQGAPLFVRENEEEPLFPGGPKGPRDPVIGVVKDSAFQFYYPENLQALTQGGATIREISALSEKQLPPVDALYIGGGFPETHAEYLAGNVSFRNALREEIESGLPVFAECGGFMYLGETLGIGERNYPMVGALPVAFAMEKRPQGHGYTVMEVEGENPFFRVGTLLRGHEFHYSRVLAVKEDDAHFVYRLKRGRGVDGQRDGLCRKNVLASYSHFHALGTEEWAGALLENARHRGDGTRLKVAVS